MLEIYERASSMFHLDPTEFLLNVEGTVLKPEARTIAFDLYGKLLLIARA